MDRHAKALVKSLVATSLPLAMLFTVFALPAQAAPHTQPKPKNDVAVHAGQQVFTQRCFACHSVIEGQQRFGPSLYGEMKAPHPKKTAVQIRGILQNGTKGNIGTMPPFKDLLTKEDTDNLLAYLRTL